MIDWGVKGRSRSREELFSASRDQEYLAKIVDNPSSLQFMRARKEAKRLEEQLALLPDDLFACTAWYLAIAITGVRSPDITKKISLHLSRFSEFIEDSYGETSLSIVTKRDVLGWQTSLDEDMSLARATTNNHLSSLSGFCTWISTHRPDLFVLGNPCQGIGPLPLPELEPPSLSQEQVDLLKVLCERLPALHEHKGKRYQELRRTGAIASPQRYANMRPYRDRAIVSVFLSTGVRREELVLLNLIQVEPQSPQKLREASLARLIQVHGKGKTRRSLWLSRDARAALADYLEGERAEDCAAFAQSGEDILALFLRASNVPRPKAKADDARGGRMALRTINGLVKRIGVLYNAELKEDDPRRIKGILHPHTLRHTFGFLLSEKTDADPYELQRALGHRSQRYIELYTRPPGHISAGYIEDF